MPGRDGAALQLSVLGPQQDVSSGANTKGKGDHVWSLLAQLWVSAVLPCALHLLRAGTFPCFSPSSAPHGCTTFSCCAPAWLWGRRSADVGWLERQRMGGGWQRFPAARAALVLWSCPALAAQKENRHRRGHCFLSSAVKPKHNFPGCHSNSSRKAYYL